MRMPSRIGNTRCLHSRNHFRLPRQPVAGALISLSPVHPCCDTDGSWRNPSSQTSCDRPDIRTDPIRVNCIHNKGPYSLNKPINYFTIKYCNSLSMKEIEQKLESELSSRFQLSRYRINGKNKNKEKQLQVSYGYLLFKVIVDLVTWLRSGFHTGSALRKTGMKSTCCYVAMAASYGSEREVLTVITFLYNGRHS